MEFHKCSQAGCHIDLDGKCLEGNPIESCPYYSAYNKDDLESELEEQEDDEVSNLTKPSTEPEYVKTYGANALNFEECEQFIRTHAAILVVLAGKFKCGKTTIITTLIQLFQQRESFADFEFAGSKTLIGFEQRCHPSRFVSMASREDTTRTARFDFDDHFAAQTFLHLRLKQNGRFYDFLIADISGEIFDELTTSTELCKKLTFLHRCDNFTLIFDADGLSELSKRGTIKTKSISILRSLIDAGMISQNCHIQILFSKWDVLLKKENPEIHKSFVKEIEKAIIEEFSLNHPFITFIETASRPFKSTGLPIGYRLDDLLKEWSSASAFLSIPQPIDTSTAKNMREFLKYQFDSNVSD